jgi:hypothetical protein
MLRLCLSLAFVVGIGNWTYGQESQAAQPVEVIFSGPQAGEAIPKLEVKGVYGDQAGKTWDLLEAKSGEPKLLIFAHNRTRPGFALTRALLTYVNKRNDDKLTGGVIFLTDDATETENWLSAVKQHFGESKRMPIVYSPDGIEGPGAYGLNRNVSMTVLVADKGKVTANFALVQPSVEADLPKILKAVVAVAGGEMPKLADLLPEAMRDRRPAAQGETDAKLAGLLRQFIQKDATDEDVKRMAEEIEAYIKDKPAVQAQLGGIITRIESANKLSDYGTAKAQEHLRAWGKKYGPKPARGDKSP